MIVVVEFVALHRVLPPSIAAVVELDTTVVEGSEFYEVNRQRDSLYLGYTEEPLVGSG